MNTETMPESDLRILVVEDNTVNQKLLTRLLQKLGHASQVAENGQEALSVFENQAFDLILMDIQMPVMDGFEATLALRRTERGKRVPIVAVTANATLEARQRAFEVGMDDYTNKPITLMKLREIIRGWGLPRPGSEDAAGQGSFA